MNKSLVQIKNVKIGGIDRNKRNKYVQLAMEDKDI
jgi:hypothetical protein